MRHGHGLGHRHHHHMIHHHGRRFNHRRGARSHTYQPTLTLEERFVQYKLSLVEMIEAEKTAAGIDVNDSA